MARSEWQQLLSHSGVGGTSSSDVIREVAGITSSATALSTANSGVTGANSSGAVQQNSNSNEMIQQMSSLVTQIAGLNSTQQAAITALQGNTQAVTQNTSSKGAGTSAGSQAAGVAESLFGGALSLSPIISGIMSLFGGGSSTPAPAMTPFMLPAPVQYDAGLTANPGGAVTPVSYAEGGQPRAQSVQPAPQVTVQVNAMDSRSFLDHSDEIANAVRTALLNSNALSDVINSL
ncbi:MAG TPA: hypothetical protein VKX49_28795 [Bryobacteraceae bacterium]|nr:hypothetical protein [Bryobacteraceae bacterium]